MYTHTHIYLIGKKNYINSRLLHQKNDVGKEKKNQK